MTLLQLIQSLSRGVDEKDGGEVSLDCPFCPEIVGKPDNKRRLGINVLNGIGHCFRCEKKHAAKGGRRYWFRELCRVFRVNYSLDESEIDSDDVAKTKPDKAEDSKQPSKLPEEFEPLWKNVNEPIGRKALKYLSSRGITEAQILQHKIGFCAVGRFAYRVVFPVYGKTKLRAFVARDFSGTSEVKYLNSEGAKGLYGIPRRSSLARRHALLVEGIFDKLAADRALPKLDIVAGLGKTLSKKQVRRMQAYERVTIWPDPDGVGIEGTIKRAIALSKKTTVFIVMPLTDIETDCDLGSMKEWEIAERYLNAVPYSKTVASLLRLRKPPQKPRKKVWKPVLAKSVS